MIDIVLEILRAFIIAMVLGVLWVEGYKKGIRKQPGWSLVFAGFVFIFFASLIDITDNYPQLNRFIVIGDTNVESFLEKVVGYLAGFILLTLGFRKWLPTIIQVQDLSESLQLTKDSLEKQVLERTGKLEAEISARKLIEQALRERKKHLRSVINNAVDGIITFDEGGTICEFNPAAEALFGYNTTEILGKNTAMLVHENHHASLDHRMRNYQAGRIPVSEISCEINGVRKDGEIFPLEFSVYETHKSEQRFFTSILRDTSERRQVEEKLRFTKFAVDHAGDAFYWIDSDASFIQINEQACRSLSYSREELLSMNVGDIDEDHSQATWPQHWQQLKQAGTLTFETRHSAKDGTIIPVELMANFVVFEGREYNFAVARDITERKNAQSEGETLRHQLQQAQKMQAIGQLTGGIAHDFNNILTVIMGFTGLAKNKYADQVDDKLAHYLEEIFAAGERARDLVSQMMDFSRGDRVVAKPVTLLPLLEEVLRMLQAILPSTIKVSTQVDNAIPKVKIDPVQIHQLVMNLCINARDAMQGGGHIDIRLHAMKPIKSQCDACHELIEGDYVELSVHDTGSGIEPEVKMHIFEPFFTTKDIGKGNGMGLSVIHGIMRENNGHIIVETQPGSGSTFRLLFPAVSEVIDADIESKNTVVSDSGNILVVDDEKSIGQLMRDLLQDSGFKTTVMSDSQAALELFRTNADKFDLLITDQTMPSLTGGELASEILAFRPDLPIIMTTGYSNDMDEARASELGIRGFLSKPLQPDKLISMVWTLLSEK